MKGRIHWFDDLSGDGMVHLEDGSSVYMHWSAIENGDMSKRSCNGRIKEWKSVKAGYIGDVEMVTDTTFRQVSKFTVTERAEPPKAASHFIDRDVMKAKLAACEAEFDELYPDSGDLHDKIRALTDKIKLSKKDAAKLEAFRAERDLWDIKIKEWAEDRTAARLAIYRQHSRFFR